MIIHITNLFKPDVFDCPGIGKPKYKASFRSNF